MTSMVGVEGAIGAPSPSRNLENSMSNVYAFFAPRAVKMNWPQESLLHSALEFLDDYEPYQGMVLPQSGEEAAEELFDLTNNPSREYERDQALWERQSLSVGDIVQVDKEYFLCEGMGWTKLPKAIKLSY